MSRSWRKSLRPEAKQTRVMALGHPDPSRYPALGIWRLLRFGYVTAKTIATCTEEARFRSVEPRQSALWMNKWSATVLRSLGVEVDCCGILPPSGALIVANHRSYIDIAVIAAQTPCSFLAKEEVAHWPLVGYGARKFANIVFVKRDSLASRGLSITAMRSILRAGVSVALFPEGTTSRGPGLLPFRPGMFRLAARDGFPVVPVALEYRDPSDAWVGEDTFVGHFLKTFSKPRISVRVHFGPVLNSSEGVTLQKGAWHWISSVLGQESREPPESNLNKREKG